jgi:hypothetical protein
MEATGAATMDTAGLSLPTEGKTEIKEEGETTTTTTNTNTNTVAAVAAAGMKAG